MEGEPDVLDWELFMNNDYPRLKKATYRYLGKFSRRACLPPGFSPDDAIYEAVRRTMDSTRLWNKESCSQIQHLWGCITSIINAEIQKYRQNLQNNIDDGSVIIIERSTAEDKLINKMELQAIISFLTEEHADLVDLFLLMHFSDIIADIEIAKHFGQSLGHIRNSKKRLRRALIAYRARRIDIA